MFGDHAGRHRHPERVTRTFKVEVERSRAALGEHGPPVIRLHDLRRTHATLLLAKGVPVKVVSERLGHSTATITLQVYAHVMPGNQRQAADLFASLIKGREHDPGGLKHHAAHHGPAEHELRAAHLHRCCVRGGT